MQSVEKKLLTLNFQDLMSISLFVYARWPDTLAMRMNCVPDPWPFEPKISRIRYTVNDYYCAKFLVIPVRGFRFFYHANIDITHPHTHIMTNLSQYLRRHTTSSAQIITLCISALMGCEILLSAYECGHPRPADGCGLQWVMFPTALHGQMVFFFQFLFNQPIFWKLLSVWPGWW